MKLATHSTIPPIASRNAQLKQLRLFLLEKKNALMLIIGPAGIGKNNLSTQLANALNREFILIQAQAHEKAKSSDLARWLANQVQIELPSLTNSQQELLNFILTELKQHQKKYLLILENAHDLPLATLAALAHLTTLQESSPPIMPVLLLGDETLIQRAQLLQNTLIPKIVLNPLTKLEAFHYFHYCAQLQKSSDYQTPSDEEFDTIYARSCGLPFVLHEIAKKWVIEHKTLLAPLERPPAFLQQHAVKMASFLGLIVFAFSLHYFALPAHALRNQTITAALNSSTSSAKPLKQ